MNHPTEAVPQRRSFLRKAVSLAGAAAVALSGRTASAETTASCSAEVAELKKQVREQTFSSLREKARLLRRLRDKFGPGVLDEAGKLTAEGAESWMKSEKIPREERNLVQVKKFFAGLPDSAEYTWVEDTPQRLQVRVTRCRWAEELRKDGNDGELGYSLACAFDPGYCAGLNPAIKFTRTKLLMKGDDHCNHTYELKA
jgi:hypothetical protein